MYSLVLIAKRYKKNVLLLIVKFLSQFYCLTIIFEGTIKIFKHWTETLLAFSLTQVHLHKQELYLLILLHLKFNSLGLWLYNVSW